MKFKQKNSWIMFRGLFLVLWASSVVAGDLKSDPLVLKRDALLASKDTFRSLGKQQVDAPSLEELRRSLGTGVVEFAQTNELMNALSVGNRKFESVEENADPSTWDFSDRTKAPSHSTYVTTHSYQLALPPGRHFNLDVLSPLHAQATIRDVADRHIVHCQPTDQQQLHLQSDDHVSTGSVLLGTAQGAWASLPHVAKALASRLTHAHSHASPSGFVMLRRVTSTEILPEGCKKLHTEDIHPYELFDYFRIETVGEYPFEQTGGSDAAAEAEATAGAATGATAKGATSDATPARHRNLKGSTFATVDPGITECSKANFPNAAIDAGDDNFANGYTVHVSASQGCLQASKDFAAFELNYNAGT